jgi:hypothetical protein
LVLATLGLPAVVITANAIANTFEQRQVERAVQERTFGPQLLQNPGFELRENERPSGWISAGAPIFDTSGSASHSGQAAVQATSVENVFVQAVVVRPERRYYLSLYARGSNETQHGRLQVNWHDASTGQLISASIEIIPVEPAWKEYETVVQSPRQPATAFVYAGPAPGSSVWYDDFFFAEVLPESR